jgi:DNA helicase-2/ATP-dependent DNA helicase PcrA
VPHITRTIGGPGTGKTRAILSQLTEAREELSLSTDEIALCTFSVAGRAEISERAAAEWEVPVESLTKTGWFRTAHSIAYKQCGVENGQLITDKAEDLDWLSDAVGATVCVSIDDRGERRYLAGKDETPVTTALQAWDVSRNQCTSLSSVLGRMALVKPRSAVSEREAANVIERYEFAKRRDGRMDFVDLISRFAGIKHSLEGSESVEPVGSVPEEIRILAIDEAQDSSRLVDAVCRRLVNGESVERAWITGDPYQSIHAFAGGDYRLFLGWEVDVEHVMPQSYRCPGVVMSLGESCLRRMRSGYIDRRISPASHDGEVRRYVSSQEAMTGIQADASALVLGRCTRALMPYIEHLKERRLPWCWAGKSTATDALFGYHAMWLLSQGKPIKGSWWRSAISMLSVTSREYGPLLAHGEKAAWARGSRLNVDFARPTPEDYELLGVLPAMQDLIRAGAWDKAIEPKTRGRATAWLETARIHGPKLASNPTIRVSTIHSAKGLEADLVVLSSQTSAAVEHSRELFPESHDEECRVAYVGVTRARRELRYVDEGGGENMMLPV